MESGTPDSLAIALDQVSKKIGLTWNTDVQALPNFKQPVKLTLDSYGTIYVRLSHNKGVRMIDKLNIGQKFIITYRPNTHNGEARPKLRMAKNQTNNETREWTDKSRVVKDLNNRLVLLINLTSLYRCRLESMDNNEVA